MKPVLFALLLSLQWVAGAAQAHQLDPAFLGLREFAPNRFAVTWKLSVEGGLANVLAPEFPAACEVDGDVRSRMDVRVRILHGTLACREPLPGQRIAIEGLPATHTDALLHVEYLAGDMFDARLTPAVPAIVIGKPNSAGQVAMQYLLLGIQHIIEGIDHLLFVLGLFIVVVGYRRLLWTVTAFTLAHTLTLATAVLGWIRLPAAPVEVGIALSILLLAVEATRPAAASVTQRQPWASAFTFGLLHGLGFAGALLDIGLPARSLGIALAAFNAGVEIGQLMFIAVLLCFVLLLRRLAPAGARSFRVSAAYLMGPVAVFWILQRSILLW
ncbi:MAG: HupE/UreJ family protein [Gammaproteobacteria bacterium]|nr:HupE/UreJ family protein [Gammaproteobacteria bacterium]